MNIRMLRRRLGDHLFVLPALVFVLVTMVYPVLYNVALSMSDADFISFVQGTDNLVGLGNYRRLIDDPELRNSFGVSILYTTGSISLMYVLGFAMALFFNQRFKGQALLRAMLLLPWVLPSVVSANIWRWMLDGTYGVVNWALLSAGLLDKPIFWLGDPHVALISVICVTAWSIAPFAMMLLLAGLQSIPNSLYEAALLDGANSKQQFRYITLPAMAPVSLMVLLLNFIYTFKTFDAIYILTRGGPGDVTEVLPILAYTRAFQFFRLGEGAAVNTVLLILPIILSVIYFRLARREQIA